MSKAAPCKTVGHAVESSMAQLSSTITVLGGRPVSEGTTISVGEKKISVVGRGKTVSVIGTNSLSLLAQRKDKFFTRSEEGHQIKSSVFALAMP
ncbi:uncharacterized protein MONOS_7224 [Monocercomonoides exilis]|uniref:uncharacterized protein n=1 Tax=Monocercomonoides exilis TaxID=2049356 RepID=UPI00355940F4|nr:hypothetical protein MONOS_7224 [Monocercomonoides exilis]|eukprot:MONOS_7224.1-p1 / transcript=MONOS_7224.1 / gene=MONOS_7224 / organism=Monocercomonoides_exilis_PA203 / gene_product=unspecified product / transcript_product=unspecified product / location=Mono_scaffold00241:78476-78821(+) / protein_length=94 / sequence_SO=supercontig / SO=protein_coding / is_pseudo=false